MNFSREQVHCAVLALGGPLYGFTGFLRNEKRQSSALTASLVAALDAAGRGIARAFGENRETAEPYLRRVNQMKLVVGNVTWRSPFHESQASRLHSLESAYTTLLSDVAAA